MLKFIKPQSAFEVAAGIIGATLFLWTSAHVLGLVGGL